MFLLMRGKRHSKSILYLNYVQIKNIEYKTVGKLSHSVQIIKQLNRDGLRLNCVKTDDGRITPAIILQYRYTVLLSVSKTLLGRTMK